MSFYNSYNKFKPSQFSKFGFSPENNPSNMSAVPVVQQQYIPTYILNPDTIKEANVQEYVIDASGNEIYMGYVNPELQVSDENKTLDMFASDTRTFKSSCEVIYEVSDFNNGFDEDSDIVHTVQHKVIDVEVPPIFENDNETGNPILETLYQQNNKGYNDVVEVEDEKILSIMNAYRSKLRNPLDKAKMIKPVRISSDDDEYKCQPIYIKPRLTALTDKFSKSSRW